MTWDWLAPTATGVVGVAGLVATSLTAYTQQRNQLKILNLQRTHNEGDILRSEKREAYLKFLHVLNEVTNTVYGNLPDSMNASYGKVSADAHEKLSSAFDELQIIAPEWVVGHAQMVQIRALQWLTAIRFDTEAGIAAYKNVITSRTYLLTAIRADMIGDDPERAQEKIGNIQRAYKEGGLDYENTADRVVKAWTELIGARNQASGRNQSPDNNLKNDIHPPKPKL